MRRRAFLKGAGVVSVAVIGGGVWRAYDQGVFSVGKGPAYEPWKDWRTANRGPLALISAAILAASPHNTQPWRFKVTDSFVELHIDMGRNVGALDPYLREEYIGMGCALENLMLAAAANGYRARATLIPGKLDALSAEPGTQLVARVDLSPGKRDTSELYDAIPRRHTNRAPYQSDKPLTQDFIDALSHLPGGDDPDVRLFLFTADEDRKKIVAISSAANRELYSDPDVQRGSEKWIRLKWSEVQSDRDGLTIDAFGLPPIATAIAKTVPPGVLGWLASHSEKNGYSTLMLSAPLIGFIAVRDRYDPAQCLKAGRIWQRAHLLATARGLAGRPCNEAVEMIDHERALGRPASRLTLLNQITGDPGWQPTFVFYMGYPTLAAHASPRRPVNAVLM